MNLENIGFYTLEDRRAKSTSVFSPLWRCELILTARCNFRCSYCRGLKSYKDMSYRDAEDVVQKWVDGGLKNIRFSGGEPTLWDGLIELVKFSKLNKIKRIAISTNGYSDIKLYKNLYVAGVNDFSISLDACCSSVGDMMAGGIEGSWKKVVENIKIISTWTYVTVGIVLNNENINELNDIIYFSDSLGVSDIRILSSVQWNDKSKFVNLCNDKNILEKHPILKYRVNNFNKGRNVRGLLNTDCGTCMLMMDDMVISDNKHYPCIIYMRENGNEIATVKNKTIQEIREERYDFIKYHNSHNDNICKNNCLDVCIDYNNKVNYFRNTNINA